ncbi:MAG: phosphomannomutase/phosphoglucomutase [Bacillota bacterium]
MRLATDIFREYDLRGVVGRDLDAGGVFLLGRAYARFLDEERSPGPVVVGRDNRLSSPELSRAVQEGLMAGGRDVVDVGEVSTPVFYYARVLYGIDGGVMVTASHNPPEFNGFKLAQGHATIYGEDIQRVRRLAESLTTGAAAPTMGADADPASTGATVTLPVARRQEPATGGREERDVVSSYLEMLKEKIALGPRRLRVVVDCGNGTMSHFAPRALRAWGCEVIPLYCESDPSFPHHHPDPIQPGNLVDLIHTVRESGADLGVAYDGDGDRLGVVAGDGSIVWGDTLMILFWREILPRYPGATALVEVKCSRALVEEIERLGGKPVFSRTGHSLIKARMKEIGAVFTGEMSGHMFFADEYFGFDDALYATGRLLRILSRSDRALHELLADVPRYCCTAETRIPCPDAAKFGVVSDLVERFRQTHQVIDVDGARVIFPDGWGLVRASNTQPALVARCEATTPAGLDRICRTMKEALSRYPEVEDFRWA